MKILTHQDILDLDISPVKCYEWVDDTLRHKDEAVLPAKISLHFDGDAFFNVMPSLIPGSNTAGVKVITRRVGRTPSLDSQIMLYRYDTLDPLALMDGSWITAMRTGAVAAHTVKNLAVRDFKTIGVMGLGNTGRASMKVLLALYPDRELNIRVLKYKDQAEEYVRYFKGPDGSRYPRVTFEVVDAVEDVVADSDVIISAVTYQEGDFASPSMYKAGCLIVAVHLRGFMGCDTVFDRVYCDDVSHVEGFKYYSQWPYSAEIAEVLGGTALGRQSDEERIIAYNVGLSLHDLRFAREVFQLSEGIGTEVSLGAPTDKFWI